jgi:hypothetical protein
MPKGRDSREGSARTNCPIWPRSSRKPTSQEASATVSDVPAGMSPDPLIQARSGSTESNRSSGCVVASRSRQIRPESNRSSYEDEAEAEDGVEYEDEPVAEAAATPTAMFLSPPWGNAIRGR